VLTLAYVCVHSVSWFFWLSCKYLPSDWLERLLWGSLFVIRRLYPQCPGWRALITFRFCVLFHCYIMCSSCSSALQNIFHIPMAWWSLFMLKVPSVKHQPANQVWLIHVVPQWMNCLKPASWQGAICFVEHYAAVIRHSLC